MMRDLVRSRRFEASVAVILSFAVPAPAGAQSGRPVQRPGWLPPVTQWAEGMTAAQRTAALPALRDFERLLLQIPELANPDGFEIQPAFAGGHRPLGPDGGVLPNSLVRYNYGLTFFAPTKAIAGEGRTCVSIVVNDDPPQAKHRGDGGFQVYLQTELLGTPVPHATEVHGELQDNPDERSFLDALFISAGALPWKPVTREEFIKALIFEFEGTSEANVAETRAAFGKTRYQEWMEGAATRKREREQMLREVSTYQSAAEVEKLRQTLEATERDVTEQLRKEEAGDRERNAGALAGITAYSDSLRLTLERMSPAERRMPALVDNALADGPMAAGYRLTSNESPLAWAVRTPNWAFWRARRSPVETRSIRVSIGMSGTCLKPEVRIALLQTFKKLDWGAIHRLLDQPR
jgi:hypothetical protein